MPDDRARVTVRLPQDAYEELCEELPSFDADTSRFQFVVQFYLDYKQLEGAPHCQCETTTDGGTPQSESPIHQQQSQSDADATSENTPTSASPENPENAPQRNADQLSSTTSGRVRRGEPDKTGE